MATVKLCVRKLRVCPGISLIVLTAIRPRNEFLVANWADDIMSLN